MIANVNILVYIGHFGIVVLTIYNTQQNRKTIVIMTFNFPRMLFYISGQNFIDGHQQAQHHIIRMLLLFSLALAAKQYIGDPIQCWCPSTFTDSHKTYVNSLCRHKYTYYLPQPHQIEPLTSYYQWIPLLLVIQATMCYFPSLIWRHLYKRSKLNIDAIVDEASKDEGGIESSDTDQGSSLSVVRSKSTRRITCMLGRYLKRDSDTFFDGIYLSTSYIFIKVLFCINAFVQIMLLNIFVGEWFIMYGFKSILECLYGEDWLSSPRLPRVIICDFEIRHQTTVHQYVVQCTVDINYYNEVIFLIIWFAFMVLCIFTFIEVVRWLCYFSSSRARLSYVKGELRTTSVDMEEINSKQMIGNFATNYLRKDGVFVLKLISENVSSLVASEVLEGLLNAFRSEQQVDDPRYIFK